MYWKACAEEVVMRLLCPEIPDLPLAELDVEARDMSEGKRFMMRICSMTFLTHTAMISSQLSS